MFISVVHVCVCVCVCVIQGGPGIRGARGDRGEQGNTVTYTVYALIHSPRAGVSSQASIVQYHAHGDHPRLGLTDTQRSFQRIALKQWNKRADSTVYCICMKGVNSVFLGVAVLCFFSSSSSH